MRDKTYFLSDMHLGASYLDRPLDYERRVVRFLRSIADSAQRIYLLGDVLDYWYEYRTVVPRGFTRFFGALADLADTGVEITWFIGNHDIWIFDYLPSELGIRVVDGMEIAEIDGKRFLMSHGDAMIGSNTLGFRFIRSMFRNKVCQRLFAAIHPRWTVPFAHRWSSSSRGYARPATDMGDDEPYIKWCRDYLTTHPHIDYFVMGHRHVLMDKEIAPDSHLIILGDWIHLNSYAVWDGSQMSLHTFPSD